MAWVLVLVQIYRESAQCLPCAVQQNMETTSLSTPLLLLLACCIFVFPALAKTSACQRMTFSLSTMIATYWQYHQPHLWARPCQSTQAVLGSTPCRISLSMTKLEINQCNKLLDPSNPGAGEIPCDYAPKGMHTVIVVFNINKLWAHDLKLPHLTSMLSLSAYLCGRSLCN